MSPRRALIRCRAAGMPVAWMRHLCHENIHNCRIPLCGRGYEIAAAHPMPAAGSPAGGKPRAAAPVSVRGEAAALASRSVRDGFFGRSIKLDFSRVACEHPYSVAPSGRRDVRNTDAKETESGDDQSGPVRSRPFGLRRGFYRTRRCMRRSNRGVLSGPTRQVRGSPLVRRGTGSLSHDKAGPDRCVTGRWVFSAT